MNWKKLAKATALVLGLLGLTGAAGYGLSMLPAWANVAACSLMLLVIISFTYDELE